MEIQVSQEQGEAPVTLFKIIGRINLGNAHELEQKGREAHQAGTRNLLIDLSEVESITSAGLRAILAVYKLLGSVSTESGGGDPKYSRLKLLNPSPYVSKVLTTAGFTSFIDIHTSLDEAISAF
ncbi:MAG: STAS domain-containing protein [Anaerolineales bacterium]|jgi:anti-anti-sigma factor